MRWIFHIVLLVLSTTLYAEKIKDIANIAGVRGNHLIGYGLVVGLDGSGDQAAQLPFAAQSLSSLLSRMGINIPVNEPGQIKNIATVIVTADLPAFIRPGQRIDITISSIGNAKSLRGGTLLMTPLKGIDGETYAIAQGSIVVNGAGTEGAQSKTQINHLSVGHIPNGAQVERSIRNEITELPYVSIELKQADFGNAEKVTQSINRRFNKNIAQALDARTIHIQAPSNANERVGFIASIEALDVITTDTRAKVIINPRTGSIVMTHAVTVEECAVAHGSLTVSISEEPVVSQPNPLSFGETIVTTKDNISISQKGGHLIRMKTQTSLADVVRALNSLGTNPQDLIAILQAIKSSGALHAELEII